MSGVWKRRVLELAAVVLATTGFGFAAAASESTSIRLGIPQGYCLLDRSHPGDSSVIRHWQQTFAQGELLAAAAVECAQLNAWRTPSLLPVDFTQYMVITGSKFEFTTTGKVITDDQRMALPGHFCGDVRQRTGQPPGESRPSFYARLTATRQALGTGEYRIVGVIDEEPAACYVVVMAAAKTNTGQPASVVHTRATAAIKGRVLQFHLIAHTSAGKEVAALQQSADQLKRMVQAHLAVNK